MDIILVKNMSLCTYEVILLALHLKQVLWVSAFVICFVSNSCASDETGPMVMCDDRFSICSPSNLPPSNIYCNAPAYTLQTGHSLNTIFEER